MPIKYIPFIPEAVEGQAVLGNFNRILRYKGADELSRRSSWPSSVRARSLRRRSGSWMWTS